MTRAPISPLKPKELKSVIPKNTAIIIAASNSNSSLGWSVRNNRLIKGIENGTNNNATVSSIKVFGWLYRSSARARISWKTRIIIEILPWNVLISRLVSSALDATIVLETLSAIQRPNLISRPTSNCNSRKKNDETAILWATKTRIRYLL